MERLQKYMARCGVDSRRACEEIISAGRVKVNDKFVTELGYKIDEAKDKIYVDGVPISPEEEKVYIMLNKPEGYVSTVKDERGRRTILDIVKVKERIYPIGRLDYDTSGLLLLTNDGEIYNRVIHPRQQINKVYIATLKRTPSPSEIEKFKNGLDIGGYVTAKADICVINKNDQTSEVRIVIHEGKNRQIRKMCDAINHPVIKLKRVSIGSIALGELKKGSWRHLDDKEIEYLKNI